MVKKKLPDITSKEPDQERPFLLEDQATQTIELGGLFTKDITSSGSFDIRGGIWASTFGKLLQSLPIPAFLVDQFHLVMVANQACSRIETAYERIQGNEFELLFQMPLNPKRSPIFWMMFSAQEGREPCKACCK